MAERENKGKNHEKCSEKNWKRNKLADFVFLRHIWARVVVISFVAFIFTLANITISTIRKSYTVAVFFFSVKLLIWLTNEKKVVYYERRKKRCTVFVEPFAIHSNELFLNSQLILDAREMTIPFGHSKLKKNYAFIGCYSMNSMTKNVKDSIERAKKLLCSKWVSWDNSTCCGSVEKEKKTFHRIIEIELN